MTTIYTDTQRNIKYMGGSDQKRTGKALAGLA